MKYLDEGKDKKSASSMFSIGISTVYRWIQERKERGNIQPKIRPFAYKYIDDEKLKQYMANHQDAFLWEIAEEFSVTKQAIFYALKRLKITRKKKTNLYKERDEQKRITFSCNLDEIPEKKRVYIDQSGFNHFLQREHGRSVRGEQV